jgi:hypothetical protein
MTALFVQRNLADLKARICANFQRVETEDSEDDEGAPAADGGATPGDGEAAESEAE